MAPQRDPAPGADQPVPRFPRPLATPTASVVDPRRLRGVARLPARRPRRRARRLAHRPTRRHRPPAPLPRAPRDRRRRRRRAACALRVPARPRAHGRGPSRRSYGSQWVVNENGELAPWPIENPRRCRRPPRARRTAAARDAARGHAVGVRGARRAAVAGHEPATARLITALGVQSGTTVSTARQQYHAATERYGRKRSPSGSRSLARRHRGESVDQRVALAHARGRRPARRPGGRAGTSGTSRRSSVRCPRTERELAHHLVVGQTSDASEASPRPRPRASARSRIDAAFAADSPAPRNASSRSSPAPRRAWARRRTRPRTGRESCGPPRRRAAGNRSSAPTRRNAGAVCGSVRCRTGRPRPRARPSMGRGRPSRAMPRRTGSRCRCRRLTLRASRPACGTSNHGGGRKL